MRRIGCGWRLVCLLFLVSLLRGDLGAGVCDLLTLLGGEVHKLRFFVAFMVLFY